MRRSILLLVCFGLLATSCTSEPATVETLPLVTTETTTDLSMEDAVVQAAQALGRARWDVPCRDLAGGYLSLVAETILDSEGLTPQQLQAAAPSEELIAAEQTLTDTFNDLGCSQVHYDIDVLQQVATLQPTNPTEVAIIAQALSGTTDRLGLEFVGLVHLIIDLPDSGFVINPVKLDRATATSCVDVQEALLVAYRAAVDAASFATDDPRVPLNMGEAMEGDPTFFNAIAALNQEGRQLGCDPAETNLFLLERHADLQPAGFWGLAFKWSILYGAAGGT